MFDGTAFCPKCGAARTRHEAESTAARCPGCRGELQQVDVGGTALLECGACDGVWVDADVFERLCADRESQVAVLPRLTTRTGTKAGAIHYRPCVRCAKMMNRVNFGRMSGTIVDVCKGHGVFLDAGELHQIVSFIQSGGLDRARAQSIEDLKIERKNLEEAQRRAAQQRHASVQYHHHHESAEWSFDGKDLMDLIGRIMK